MLQSTYPSIRVLGMRENRENIIEREWIIVALNEKEDTSLSIYRLNKRLQQ